MRQQRPTLSGRTWGRLAKRSNRPHGYEDASFQAYQFDGSLQSVTRTPELTLSVAAYHGLYGDKSLGWHVEKLLTDCYGLRLERAEVPWWPW